MMGHDPGRPPTPVRERRALSQVNQTPIGSGTGCLHRLTGDAPDLTEDVSLSGQRTPPPVRPDLVVPVPDTGQDLESDVPAADKTVHGRADRSGGEQETGLELLS